MNRLQQMPPEERERFLQNNEKFQGLPPQQQEQIRQRAKQFDKLTPEQRQNLEKNAKTLEQMTPEQRQKIQQTYDSYARLTPEQRQAVRTQLLPQWKNLSLDRRQEIKQRLNSLNGIGDAERNQKLNDPNFYQGLSPQEHNVLKQMGDLRLNPGAGGM
jgi:Protein of unknown function (DUF3106)